MIASIDIGIVNLGYCIMTKDKQIKELKNVNIKPESEVKQTIAQY
jgi:hypothetical protein